MGRSSAEPVAVRVADALSETMMAARRPRGSALTVLKDIRETAA